MYKMPVRNNHDLNLPAWGPYTKKYIGISHIPDPDKGLRFDLSIFPGFYRREVLVPNAKWESGYHPWEASPDLQYFSYRYELEWKDQVYCDLSFAPVTENVRLARCEMVNQTDLPQNLVLHYMAYMNFPPLKVYSDEALFPALVHLPDDGFWLDALDYDDLKFAITRPTDSLVTDAMRRGEIRYNGLVGGRGVGQGFGKDAGDTLWYHLESQTCLQDARLLLRYRTPQGGSLTLRYSGKWNGVVDLPESQQFNLIAIPLGNVDACACPLVIESLGGTPIDLDGFAIVPAGSEHQVNFTLKEWNPTPLILSGPRESTLILKYEDTETYYGLSWRWENWKVRQFLSSELDRFLRHRVHEHVQTVMRGDGGGHFTNVFLRPIPLEPHTRKVLYGMVCSGTREEVENTLQSYDLSDSQAEAYFDQARSGVAHWNPKPAGRSLLFSQERMSATTLMNVVYPIYAKGKYIRHGTPGKWWDCLYTWDSGFIGLGLLEIDVQRAIDNLNAYVTEPGDPQTAFIHHGSPVPMQFYLFQELMNRTQDRQLLEYFYPRMRQYYLFMAGRIGSSTTRVLPSNLLKTWDYFYNSGGWDDYPPQVYVHANQLEKSVSPVISSSQVIRCGKILQLAAQELGLPDDVADYQADINTIGAAVQKYSWDEGSGYFGYVCHDDQGNPTGILRHNSGQNYNMGLDGVYPLVAGITTPEQEKLLLAHLSSPAEMWTPIGISTVDQSAAYYRVDGYWNGAVWPPHQWIFWKRLLDLNETNFAHKVGKTALDIWAREVDASYHCFEHFIVQSGRGAGWHQFGGLSTPVMKWFASYYQPGTFTTGYDVWVKKLSFSQYNRSLSASLRIDGNPGGVLAVLASMAEPGPGVQYKATWNGQPVPVEEVTPGTLQVLLPRISGATGILEINGS
ncbi:MAG TPA: trehalase family glycosidase [Anaerolineaceae bacterium]